MHRKFPSWPRGACRSHPGPTPGRGRSLALFPIIIALGLLGGACARPEPEPEQVLERFLANLRHRRADEAWRDLAAGSRAELEARHLALARAAGRPEARGTPREMLFRELGLLVLGTVQDLVLVSAPGDEARVRVLVKDGRSAEVLLVREKDGWKVELWSALSRPPASAARSPRSPRPHTAASPLEP